jgi:hypothetical protein
MTGKRLALRGRDCSLLMQGCCSGIKCSQSPDLTCQHSVQVDGQGRYQGRGKRE